MITWIDWGIWAIYLAVIYTALWFYRHSKTDDIYKWFLKGFLIKVFGGVAFAIIYVYYYGGGDTFEYFKNSSKFANYFFSDISIYFKLLFSRSENISPELAQIASTMPYSKGSEEWFTVKFLSVINILSLNSYLVMTLISSLIAFLGSWKLFIIFKKRTTKPIIAFISVFLAPSVIFWGTGILKDTFVLAFFSFSFWCIYLIIFENKIKVKYLLIGLLMSYMSYHFKSYVFILFLPSLSLILFLYSLGKTKIKIIKIILIPIYLSITLFIGYTGIVNLTNNSGKYKISSLETKVKGFHSWHAYQGGSVYNLGEIEYTIPGVAKKILPAINVSFFRPYLWEVKNIVMLLSSVESLFLLLLFIRLVFYRFKNIHLLFTDRFILILFLYCVVLGFTVGFTSYNFGALARYKIPFLSMLFFILLKLNYDPKQES